MEQLTPADFDGVQLRRPRRYAVCFHATWCGFCRRFLPAFRERDGRLGGRLAEADISDEENPLWGRFGIEVVPALRGFEDGTLAWAVDSPLGVGLDARALATLEERLGPAPRATSEEKRK